MIQLAEAVLALIGLIIVVVLFEEEALPILRYWWDDLQEGRAHFQNLRLERRIREETISAAGDAQEAVELAKRRMQVTLEQSRRWSTPERREH